MPQAPDNSAAIVFLPPASGRLRDRTLVRWLARSAIERRGGPRDVLGSILRALGRERPRNGLGAMRMWGQTNDRPTVWIAAADPVYLEPRLNHLCLHSLQAPAVTRSELRALFDHLQETLAEDQNYGFARIGACGYLRAGEPIPTALEPPSVVDQCNPNDYLPAGEDAAGFRKLQSEIEMALHEHPVNVERELEGRQPVNSLWLWGGGTVPDSTVDPHPPLFADDPLLKGYWNSVAGDTESWPGTIAACLEASAAGFVAVVPGGDDDVLQLERYLSELREALQSRRLSRLSLIFADGICATVERADRYRFWRRNSALLNGELLIGDRE
ncbi:MAG: hypothetical protein ACR2QX_14445 [Woeseiaceae bacterium]